MKNTPNTGETRRKSAGPLSLKLLKTILNTITEAAICHNAEGTPVFANAAAVSMLGFDPVGLKYRTFVKKLGIRNPDGSPVPFNKFPSGRALRGEKIEPLRYILAMRGEEVSVLAACNPVSESGVTAGAVLTLRDITQWDRLLKQREKESTRLVSLFEKLPIGISILNEARQVVFRNSALLKILRISPEGFVRGTYAGRRYIHPNGRTMGPDEFPSAVAFHNQHLVSGAEVGVIPEDGEIIWTQVSAVPVDFGEWRIAIATVDITGRKLAEERLMRKSGELEAARIEAENGQRRIAAVLEVLPVGMAITDERGGSVMTNRAYDLIWSGPRPVPKSVDEYAAYKAWWSDTGKALEPGEWASAQAIKRGETVTGQMLDIQRFDGSRASVINSAAPLFDAGGKIIGSTVAIQDITDLRNAEEALRESEGRLSQFYEATFEGIVLSKGGIVVDCNEQMVAMTGYTVSELKGMPIADFIVQEDRDRVMENIRLERESLIEERILHKNGSHITVEAHGRSVGSGTSGRLRYTVVRDITKRKRLEEELVRSQKLESVGILAGGIAHDFNNLLTAVMGYLGIARARINPGDRLYTLLEKAQNATAQAAQLTQRLITFARGGEPLMKTSFIGGLIRETAGLSLSGSNIQSRIELPDDLWPVRIDEAQMRQVFQNIIINAREAIPEGGSIEITAENAGAGSEGSSPASGGRNIRISIRDHGTGIRREHLKQIFDPYFSTKERGTQKGMGLGLSVCHSIITKHGGAIGAESAPSKGTVIHITLPASDEKPEEFAKRRPRVLVMDDEEIVLTISNEILREGGFDVSLAKNSAAALSAYTSAVMSNEPFDVVLLDLILPGERGGVETLKELRAIDKNVRAILFSAYLDDPAVSDFRESGFIAVLPKPFTADMLIDIVSRVAGAGAL